MYLRGPFNSTVNNQYVKAHKVPINAKIALAWSKAVGAPVTCVIALFIGVKRLLAMYTVKREPIPIPKDNEYE
jgi:hypothetical protein